MTIFPAILLRMYSTLFSERARGAVGILSLTSQKQNFFNPIFPSLVITPPHLKHNHPEFSRSHSNDSQHGAITTQPWADAPYPLLHTPIFEQKFPLNKDTDQCTETASKMCITHNFLIRRLNTIVLQAKHVEPKDYKDFVGYTRVWCEVTNAHREDGGSFVFSQIKAAAGKEGLMVGNVREHGTYFPLAFPLSSFPDMCRCAERRISSRSYRNEVLSRRTERSRREFRRSQALRTN